MVWRGDIVSGSSSRDSLSPDRLLVLSLKVSTQSVFKKTSQIAGLKVSLSGDLVKTVTKEQGSTRWLLVCYNISKFFLFQQRHCSAPWRCSIVSKDTLRGGSFSLAVRKLILGNSWWKHYIASSLRMSGDPIVWSFNSCFA